MFIRKYKIFIGLSFLLLYGCEINPVKTESNKETLMLDSIAELYHSRDFDNSIKLCERFIVNYPNNDKGWHLLSSSYLAKDKDSIAEVCANKALQINPKNYIALTNLGVLLDKKGEYDKAIIFYEKSLQINDSLPQTYSNYMVNRMKIEDYKYAVELGEKALKFGNHIWDKAHLCFSYHKIQDSVKRDSLLEELRILNFEKLSSLEAKIFEASE